MRCDIRRVRLNLKMLNDGVKYRVSAASLQKIFEQAFRDLHRSHCTKRAKYRREGELMNYGWPVNREKERERESERSVLCRSLPPPGLWKCHAASVAMQMVTLECYKREGRKSRAGFVRKNTRKRETQGSCFIFVCFF